MSSGTVGSSPGWAAGRSSRPSYSDRNLRDDCPRGPDCGPPGTSTRSRNCGCPRARWAPHLDGRLVAAAARVTPIGISETIALEGRTVDHLVRQRALVTVDVLGHGGLLTWMGGWSQQPPELLRSESPRRLPSRAGLWTTWYVNALS